MVDLDTGTAQLSAEVDDGVAVLRLNRPERRNAFSPAMIEALIRILAEVEVDDEVGVVVLTGAGEAFCAGGDVKEFATGTIAATPYDTQVHRQRIAQRATAGKLWAMPKPTIAALPGAAAGAGLSLALACDLRYAVDGAVLTTAFARVGFSGDFGGSWFLTRLVGPARAKELYFFSPRISAAQAAAMGLVNEVFPADCFEAEVMARAHALAAGPRIAYRYMKENLNRAMTATLEDCLDLEATHHLHTGRTEDHLEAAQAFVEKRQPRFHGR
ncbi:MAG: enoyl-CoA hydratase-related protein [Mycobacteriales bacterium]